MDTNPKYLTRLFNDLANEEVEKSPEEIEAEAQAEADQLVKQQSNYEDMYTDEYGNRYYADTVIDGDEGIYNQSPEGEQIVTEQHEAEDDPELFIDGDGEIAEVEHTDMEGNPISPEVVKQALYEEYIYNKYYADTEDEEDEDSEEDEELETVKQSLLEDYIEGRLYSADEVEEYMQTIMHAAYDDAEAQIRQFSEYGYNEPITYFFADDEEGEEGEGQPQEGEGKDTADKAKELTGDDEKPAVEVVEETKSQADAIIDGVSRLLTK